MGKSAVQLRIEYEKYHKTAKEKSINLHRITESMDLNLADLSIQIQPPLKDNYKRKEDNNASLIVSLHFKNESFLFCGDAMEERLEEFISNNKNEYDYVKLPYHGNFLDNYEAFLNSVKPKVGVICCSEKNPVDDETLQLLSDSRIQIYQTKTGQVHITADGNKTSIDYT